MTCRVAFVVYEEFGLLDVVGPSEALTIANQLAGRSLYESVVVASRPSGPVVSESNLRLDADVDITRTRKRFDTVLVSGGLGYRQAMTDEALVRGLRRLNAGARRIGSICTGAFILAASGALDGRRVTTHWAYGDELQARFPACEVVVDELYVLDGEVITAAGVAAGIDLGLAMIAADHSPDLAKAVSRRMVVYRSRAGGQSQFSERFEPARSGAESALEALLAEISAEPAGDYAVEALAARVHMSRRHFARMFRKATGTTPARWVERVRVDVARKIIDQTAQSIEDVADQAGFGSVHTMRQAFHRVVGLSPNHYRALHAGASIGSLTRDRSRRMR